MPDNPRAGFQGGCYAKGGYTAFGLAEKISIPSGDLDFLWDSCFIGPCGHPDFSSAADQLQGRSEYHQDQN